MIIRAKIYLCVIATFPILLAGCVTLSPEARQVHLVRNTQEISACNRLGPISTKTMACVNPETCMSEAAAEGRNQAAAMGATHLFETYRGITLTHGIFDGIAYRCAENRVGVQRIEMTEPGSTGGNLGCTKDIECKGNRICVSGQCVAP